MTPGQMRAESRLQRKCTAVMTVFYPLPQSCSLLCVKKMSCRCLVLGQITLFRSGLLPYLIVTVRNIWPIYHFYIG